MPTISFTPPPGWPELPAGFLPEAGWRPDPSWPPAPAGWQFYHDAYGYPTPPPLEYWQPWPAVDWQARLARGTALEEPADPSFGMGPLPQRRRRRWWPKVLAALLALALLGGLLAWGIPRLRHEETPAPKAVADVKGLYQPPLPVGAASYQLAGSMTPSKSFEGNDSCVKQANAVVSAATQGVIAGTDRGWSAVTWRFADTAAATKAYTALTGVLDGCTASDYKLGSPVHSPDAAKQWVQYSQTAKDGTDHGRVVLTSDANTLTWIEGGRTDMGATAFAALRKRLATLK